MGLSHLLRLQKRILDAIEDDLSLYRQRKTRELKAYERDYAREFHRDFRLSSKTDLLKRMRKSQLVFCGDYHSFRQSQKTAIRLLRDAIRDDPRYILCVECIPAQFQEELRAFHRREFDVDELRIRVRYDEFWPFPWNHYRDLFVFAQENDLPIFGLESRRESLAERDIESARIIANTAIEHPEHRLFVFYGDLHIARKHLPRATREILRSNGRSFKATIIFQNEPRIFWRLARNGNAHTTDVVALRADTWCIMNATPWVRLQSYVDWLEGETGEPSDDASDMSASGNVAGKLNAYAHHLQHFLQCDTTRDIDVTVYSFEDIQSFGQLLKRSPLPLFKAKAIKYAILVSRPMYFAEDKVVYVPSNSLNLLAEAAALAVRGALVPNEEVALSPRAAMAQLILNAARAYFGSKVINPKRKCDELDDIDRLLEETRGRKRNILRFKRTYYQWARREIDWVLGVSRRVFRPHGNRFTFAAGWEAARLAGSLLAERLHYAFLEGSFEFSGVDRLFRQPIATEAEARELLRELGEHARKSGYPIRSKREKL